MTALLPLLLGLALASPPEPSQEPAPAVPVCVEVDVSALPDGEDIGHDLRQQQVQALTEGGFAVGDEADATIRVAVSRWGEGEIHYRFVVSLHGEGTSEPSFERTGTCELCTESELYAKIGEEVARVSGRLLFLREQQTKADPPEPEPEDPQPDPNPPNTDQPKARRIGGVGWVGIAAAAAGLAVAGGGVVVLISPEERTLAPADDRRDRIADDRPLGGALIGVGLGVLATGAVLIAVDQTILLQRRRERARTISLVPSLLPAGAGLTWSGRF